jgi:hypothetical protein
MNFSLDQQQSPKEITTSPLTITQESLPEYLYGSKMFLNRSKSDSRRNLTITTSSLKNSSCCRRSSATSRSSHNNLTVQSAFLQDLERRRKTGSVKFELPTTRNSDEPDDDVVDYGYDQDIVPPPPKRRRFRMARRNSKTPQMLLAMNASLASLDFLRDLDQEEEEDNKKEDDGTTMMWTSTTGTPGGKEEDTEHDDDDGLQIAEELVKQLQLSRNRHRSSATAVIRPY